MAMVKYISALCMLALLSLKLEAMSLLNIYNSSQDTPVYYKIGDEPWDVLDGNNSSAMWQVPCNGYTFIRFSANQQGSRPTYFVLPPQLPYQQAEPDDDSAGSSTMNCVIQVHISAMAGKVIIAPQQEGPVAGQTTSGLSLENNITAAIIEQYVSLAEAIASIQVPSKDPDSVAADQAPAPSTQAVSTEQSEENSIRSMWKSIRAFLPADKSLTSTITSYMKNILKNHEDFMDGIEGDLSAILAKWQNILLENAPAATAWSKLTPVQKLFYLKLFVFMNSIKKTTKTLVITDGSQVDTSASLMPPHTPPVTDIKLDLKVFPKSILLKTQPSWLTSWLSETGYTKKGRILHALWDDVVEIKNFIYGDPKIPYFPNLLATNQLVMPKDLTAQAFYKKLMHDKVILITFRQATIGLTINETYAHEPPYLRHEMDHLIKQNDHLIDHVTQLCRIKLIPLGNFAVDMEAERKQRPEEDTMTRFAKFYLRNLLSSTISPFLKLTLIAFWGGADNTTFTFQSGKTQWKFSSEIIDSAKACAEQHAKLSSIKGKAPADSASPSDAPAASPGALLLPADSAATYTSGAPTTTSGAHLLPTDGSPKASQADVAALMLDQKTDLGTEIIDQVVDLVATGKSGSYIVDATPELIHNNLAQAATFLAAKATMIDAEGGNSTLAQELLLHAQYAADCFKTFHTCMSKKAGEKLSGIAKHSPFLQILQNLRDGHATKKEKNADIADTKYSGIVQEWCAYIGCKSGDLAFDILTVILLHKAGTGTSGTTPPAAATATGGAGTSMAVATLIADGAIVIVDSVKVGMAMASGPKDADKTGASAASSGPDGDAGTSTSAGSDKDSKKSHPEVKSMKEFFQLPFGKVLRQNSQSMKKYYQGQKMYKITAKIPETSLKIGDIFYLDASEKNHLEVFDAQGYRTSIILSGRRQSFCLVFNPNL